MKHLTIPLFFLMFVCVLSLTIAFPRKYPKSASCEDLDVTSKRMYNKKAKELRLGELMAVVVTNQRECNGRI